MMADTGYCVMGPLDRVPTSCQITRCPLFIIFVHPSPTQKSPPDPPYPTTQGLHCPAHQQLCYMRTKANSRQVEGQTARRTGGGGESQSRLMSTLTDLFTKHSFAKIHTSMLLGRNHAAGRPGQRGRAREGGPACRRPAADRPAASVAHVPCKGWEQPSAMYPLCGLDGAGVLGPGLSGHRPTELAGRHGLG